MRFGDSPKGNIYFDQRYVTMIDIGSTFTKGLMIDLRKQSIIKNKLVPTNARKGVQFGFFHLLNLLHEGLDGDHVKKTKILVCSSAAGGLKIVVVGLTPRLSVKAGRLISYNAGGKVVGSFSYKLSDKEIEQIDKLKADIILLSGGINGGDEETISHNALKLSKLKTHPFLVIAGNKCVADEVANIFNIAGKPFKVTENVLPEINILNVEPAKDTIRNIFYEKIVFAKGLERVTKIADNKVVPTPSAVLSAVKLLSEGTDTRPGVGSLILIDIGGATTDVHSIGHTKHKPGLFVRGLPEPYLKRTVEGDLGLRISAKSLLERGQEAFPNNQFEELSNYAKFVEKKTDYIPNNPGHKVFDVELAKLAIKLSFSRHCGFLKSFYTPNGEIAILEGKDLSAVKTVIGTGGIFSEDSYKKALMLKGAFSNIGDKGLLKPRDPTYLADSNYIFWAMGLLSNIDPNLAYDLLIKSIGYEDSTN